MVPGYYGATGGDQALFDELLCEYVDDAVDHTVRAAFDECMRADSSLARRVKCLRRTRRLLEQYRCRETSGMHLRVRQRLFQEMQASSEETPAARGWSPLLGTGLVATVVLCAMLITGTAGPLPDPAPPHSGPMPVSAFAGDLRQTPLAGPVPSVPVWIAPNPPLSSVRAAAHAAVP